MRYSTRPIPAAVYALSPSTSLVLAEKGGAYFLRGRDVFILSDAERARLTAILQEPRDDEGIEPLPTE